MIGSWLSDQGTAPTTNPDLKNSVPLASSFGALINNSINSPPLMISTVTTASSVGDVSLYNNYQYYNNNNNNYQSSNNANQNYYYYNYNRGGGPQFPEELNSMWMTCPFNSRLEDETSQNNSHKRKFDEYVNYLEENEEEEDIIEQLTDEDNNKFFEDDPSSCLFESLHERNFCKRVKSQHHQDRLSAQLSHLHVSEESNTSNQQHQVDNWLNNSTLHRNAANANDMEFNEGDWCCTQLVCCPSSSSTSSLTTNSLMTSCIPKTRNSHFVNGKTLNVSTDNQMMKSMWQKKLSSLISQSTGNSSNPISTLLLQQKTDSTLSPLTDTALFQSVLGDALRNSRNMDGNPNEHAVVPYTSSREEILKRLRTRFDSTSNGKYSPKTIDDPHSTGSLPTDTCGNDEATNDLMTDEN